jgi:hypothetical protein
LNIKHPDWGIPKNKGPKDELIAAEVEFWNSAFNAQGSRVIMILVQVGAVKIYVAAAEQWRRWGKRKDRMKLNLSPKLVSLGPSYFIL